MIPPEFLKSILSALKSLVKNFGVTVIFCTATQPALCGKIGTNGSDFDGIPEDSIFPIIENPQKLAAELKRVELNTDFAKEKFSDWESVANELQKFPQVLCIVQTRKDCRTLHGLMPQGTIHLSALMCAQERTETVTEIKQKLKNGEPVRVICTRLVECGVDMDFPVVFKSMAGLDSVAQAAGRCNREGKSDSGKVFLFEPPSKVPSGLLKKSADAAREILKKYDYRIQLTPEIYSEYFKKYFSRVNDFDSCGFFQAMIKNSMEAKFQFRTLGENYHLINDSFQGTIYVYYESQKTGENNFDLIQRLQQGDADKFLLKKLARYSVNLPLNEIQELAESGRVLKVFDDAQIFVQADNDRNLYRNGIGLAADSLQSFALYVF
jgi:CRISPR-associated endonuclease/helicase Cas3